MDPATIALIVASLGEAAKYAFQLSEIIRRATAGEIDDDVALMEWQKATMSYESARQMWDSSEPPIA